LAKKKKRVRKRIGNSRTMQCGGITLTQAHVDIAEWDLVRGVEVEQIHHNVHMPVVGRAVQTV
jgi:hypothetical protein